MPSPATPEDIDYARRAYAALERGDLEAVLADLPEHVEWRNPEDAIEGGVRRGRDEFRVALEALLESFEGMSLTIEDSVASGDDFAVLIRTRARGRASGAPLDQLFGHVFRFEDDVQVALEWYNDPGEALRAIGASGWAGGAPVGS